MKKIVRDKKPFVRVNSRIREDQFRFIKSYAAKRGLTDGEAMRVILDNYMINA